MYFLAIMDSHQKSMMASYHLLLADFAPFSLRYFFTSFQHCLKLNWVFCFASSASLFSPSRCIHLLHSLALFASLVIACYPYTSLVATNFTSLLVVHFSSSLFILQVCSLFLLQAHSLFILQMCSLFILQACLLLLLQVHLLFTCYASSLSDVSLCL